MEGSSNNASTYLWNTSGTGLFENQSLPITNYISSELDLNNKEIIISLTAQLEDCYWSDTSLIILNKNPKVDIYSDEFLCHEDSSILLNILTSGNSPIKYDLELNNENILSYSNLLNGIETILISELGYYRITNLKDAFCDGKDSEEYNLTLKINPSQILHFIHEKLL